MADSKYKFGASVIISLLIAMIVYALLNPIVVWYLDIVPQLFSCGSSGIACELSSVGIAIFIPLFALFLCVGSVFEVFLK